MSLLKTIFVYFGFWDGHVLPGTCGGQRETLGSSFSPFNMWVLGLELGSPGLVGSSSTQWAHLAGSLIKDLLLWLFDGSHPLLLSGCSFGEGPYLGE